MAVSHAKAAKVDLPEAAVLADLYGIEHDLVTASYLCAKVAELLRSNPYDYPLIEGLVSAAIIRYCRCYGHAGGVRLGLTMDDISELTSENRASHQYIDHLRDKFIAHSINPFEQSYVTADVAVRDGVKLPVRSIHGGYHRLVPAFREAAQLSELIAAVLEIVRKRVEDEKTKLLGIIQALPLEVVHGWDLHTPQSFKASDAGKVRRQSKRPKTTCE